MKRLNQNKDIQPWFVAYQADGLRDVLPIDGFPLSDHSLLKADGWPMSDIGILDRYSRDQNIDQEEIARVAARLEVIKAQPRQNKSDDELLRELRPAWVQTAAEFADYDEAVMLAIQREQNSKTEKESAGDASPSEAKPGESVVELNSVN